VRKAIDLYGKDDGEDDRDRDEDEADQEEHLMTFH
jgi:hypothetical protein